MTMIFRDGALHPGRDPSDAWWFVVRRPEEWTAAAAHHVETVVDDDARTVELAPAPLAIGDEVHEVTGPDGTWYRSLPELDRVVMRGPCDAEPVRVPGLGAGWATGELRAPRGLAVDERGWLYIADSGNHRVQVLAPREGRIVAVLRVAELREPWLVAIGRTRIYVADRAGMIFMFDRRFRFAGSFAPRRPSGGGLAPVTPLAIAVDRDDLLIADRSVSTLFRFHCDGAFAGTRGMAGAPAPLAALAGAARFSPVGTVELGPTSAAPHGPFDAGIDGFAWHQIAVDAALPPGTRVEVQTYAADADPSTGLPVLPSPVPWAPAAPVAIPLAGVERDGESVRPVLSDTDRWQRARAGAMPRRASPLVRFDGDGPIATALMALPFSAARLVRAGDRLGLGAGAAIEAVDVAAIAPRTATLIAWGDRARYAAGARVELVERDGRAVEPAAVVHALTGAEEVDLTAMLGDGDGGDVELPHPIAAVVRPGDVLRVVGSTIARVLVDELDTGAAAVQLTAAVAGDHARTAVTLMATPGRLVLEDSDAWPAGFTAGEPIEVDGTWTGTVRWSDADTATVWTATAPPSTWASLTTRAVVRGTDRGRFLWVRLRLHGARAHRAEPLATASPSIRSVRVIGPRAGYLPLLPAVYGRRDADDPSGALFLERFLAMIETRLGRVETRYEELARELNPAAASPDWLRFLGTWFGLAFDPSWPEARRARLVACAFELFRRRGTREGIAQYVEIYTGRTPVIVEGFQRRPRSAMVLGTGATLGCAPLSSSHDGASGHDHAHRFTLYAEAADDCERALIEPVIRAIVESTRPVHTLAEVIVTTPSARVGLQSTIGMDLVVGPPGEPALVSDDEGAPTVGLFTVS